MQPTPEHTTTDKPSQPAETDASESSNTAVAPDASGEGGSVGADASDAAVGAGDAAVQTTEDAELRAALEAVLMLAETPLSPRVLAAAVEDIPSRVAQACEALAAEYAAQGRGFTLARVAGGYRYQTSPAQDAVVARFVSDPQSSRLSAAALETLAVVAYKQPVSRLQVAEIRGVNADGVMQTLRRRGYIDEVARDPGPGQAVLFGTTPQFLEQLGLDSLADLPPLEESVPVAASVEALERKLRIVPESSPPESADADAADDDGTDDADADADDIETTAL